jgi:iron-sulfur cluster assembly protein
MDASTHTHAPAADAASGSTPEIGPAPARQHRLDVTPIAARKIYEGLKKRGTPGSALRVGVRGGGCSGFTYVLEFADGEPKSRDLVFEYPVARQPQDTEEPGSVRVFCDKKSIIYLSGTTLDWMKTLMFQGFKFVNPQEKSSCGCNQSFAV